MKLGRRKLNEEHVRKLQRTGENGSSYTVTIPRELIEELDWRKKQKVVITRHGRTLVIKDWK